MTISQLKTGLHQLIDSSRDENLLSVIHELLKQREKIKPGDLWDSLSEDQKKEVLMSDEDASDPSKLIDHDQVMNKAKKWLGE